MDHHALAFAVRQFLSHPGVSLLGGPEQTPRGADVMFQFDLEFGARWRAQGESPTGVRSVEEVRLSFPADFPASPPEISLRPDFSREHPHIQPYLLEGGRVVPCVIDAQMAEFLAAAGYRRLAEQIMIWLMKAANDDLMSGAAGWEPARRDSLQDFLLLNEEVIRKLGGGPSGHAYYETSFWWLKTDVATRVFRGALTGRSKARDLFRVAHDNQGCCPALIVWPDGTVGNRKVCDRYLPDDVQNVGDLLERAEIFGLRERLKKVIPHLDQASRAHPQVKVPLIVLMLVKRPRNLINCDSDIEIQAYLIPELRPGGAFSNSDDEVRPLGLRGSVEPGVLRRMSGTDPLPSWALLGAGSLGSKVALHLAREASPPCMIADPAMLSPHNAARHGLYPARMGDFLGWLQGKADALANVLNGFGERPVVVPGDHRQCARVISGMHGSKRPEWLVNATASLHVREDLSRREFEDLPSIVEMALFGAGGIGYLSVEGQQRNPNSFELIAEFYHSVANDPELSAILFGESQAARVALGQGCGSFTTVMSDARVSGLTAVMTEVFGALEPDAAASVRILRKNETHGLDVQTVAVPSFIRVPIEGLEGWYVSIPERINARICMDIERYPGAESGGVIVGHASMVARRIVVTDVVDAPSDSKRKASSFVLGTSGLEDRLSKIEAASSGVLRRLGTWHSHLGGAEPSAIDWEAAGLVAAGAEGPMVLLIKGSDGFRAISRSPELPEIKAERLHGDI